MRLVKISACPIIICITLIDCCLINSQIKESKIDFLPQENALCFDPEEDQTGMKLVLIQHRLDTIEQLFKTKVNIEIYLVNTV